MRTAWPTPKRGNKRTAGKRLGKKKQQSKTYKQTPYVRFGTRTKKSRGERAKWSMDLKTILAQTDASLTKRCLRDKILENKAGKVCPRCTVQERKAQRACKEAVGPTWAPAPVQR